MSKALKQGLLLIFSAGILFGALGNITGKAVDETGKPVPNAFVTFTNLDNRFSWAYADSQGNFDLGIGGGTGISVPRNAAMNQDQPLIRVHGSVLYFYAKDAGPVLIDVFSPSGKHIVSHNASVLSAGTYSIDPLSGLSSARTAKAVYIVKVSQGEFKSTCKIIGISKSSNPLLKVIKLDALSAKGSQNLAKSTADVEIVRVGRTGYIPASVPVQSFTQNIGSVKITKMNLAARVDSIFATLTLDQKIYQLVMCDVQNVHPKDIATKTQIGTYLGAGGVKPPDGNTPAKWAAWLDSFQVAQMQSPMKVPLIIGYDAVHGLNVCQGGTILPHNIGLGATWDPELVKKAYRMEAVEVRGTGANWTFSPCIAVPRHLHWGRVYEGFGETPEIAQQMARAAVLGFQGWDLSHPLSIAACIKHFAADGGTDGGANGGDCTAADNVLRAIHLPGYVQGVGAEAATAMPSFSSWRGTPMHFNKPLLTDYLKTQLGFDGFVVGDFYGDFWGNLGTKDAIAAGLDVPMHTGDPVGGQTALLATYNGGAQDRVTDAVKRVLRTKVRLGLFDKPVKSDPAVTALIGCQLHRDIARECVRKSLVLLKNTNSVLPIAKTKKIHLVGDFATSVALTCGGWTITWQGGDTIPFPVTGTTVRQGFEKLTKGTITWSADAAGIDANADVVIVCVGEKPYAEGDGDNGSLSLSSNTIWNGGISKAAPINYTQLITDCKAKGKPLVGILFSGRPMIITNEIQKCDAFIAAWLPGTEAGGIAELLYGDYDFSGKLTHTWPTSYAQEPINTGAMGDPVGAGGAPLFPYDYGLNLAGKQLPAGFYTTAK